ncbi:LCP family protein [Longispora fulva]|uniref:LCP family protein required for cell wall assembly n=1 Tax=Longispora fulva TaxID=619741 RepID=A0A8J7H4E3_9ACTN|nr:LCP family protein [Longispora fulva]MBG6141253.1 LCP family protein required for cell wall assembly [Longispora fulva]
MSQRRRILLLLAAAVALVLVGAGLAAWSYARSLESRVPRTDAFAGLHEERPQRVVPGALNVLLLGTDSRNPEDMLDGSRSDTLILVHVPASHDAAYLVSIPRDTWVHVPANPNGGTGDADAKINAALAWGGLPLAIRTVEEFTGVRIDHVAMIDFGGLVAVTDALGGVDMVVEQDTTSTFEGHRFWPRGTDHFDGASALEYIRQRKQFADGDFTRIRHQQGYLIAMLAKAANIGMLTNPFALRTFLETAARAVVVDTGFALVDTAIELRDLRAGQFTCLTSPSAGTGSVGDQSVVWSDPAQARPLYAAVAADDVPGWLSTHPTRDCGQPPG